MSFGKNVKRSVTYEFELTSSKILAPVSRYKGYSKVYQLNFSKMLLKHPDSALNRKDREDNEISMNPQLLVVSTQKLHSLSKRNNITNSNSAKFSSDAYQAKIHSLKKSIRSELLPDEHLQFAKKYIKNQQYDRTVSPLKLNNSKEMQSRMNSIKMLKNEILKASRRKDNQTSIFELTPATKKEESEADSRRVIDYDFYVDCAEQKIDNSIVSLNHSKPQRRRKTSLHSNQPQPLIKLKQSKKILLPQIKQQSQPPTVHTYNLSTKSNIPVLYRDPEQLKHIKSQAYSIIEYPSGNLLLSSKGANQYQIASLTKIMTFYVVLKIVEKFNLVICRENVRINDIAMDMTGTSAEIEEGEVYSVEELLYGLMLPSGNDAATALAEWGGKHLLNHQYQPFSPVHFLIDGHDNQMESEESMDPKAKIKAFINEMNYHARYANPHGLPNCEARSSAIDVARLCGECLKNDFFRKVVGTRKYKCTPFVHNRPNKKRNVEWLNTNKLLRRQGFIGIKTGITVTAGPCLASAYTFKQKTYICVVLRATKVSRRFKQTRKLLAWSLQKLYKQCLSVEQQRIIASLRKNKPDLDSDYSEDQQEFNYEQVNKAEFKKRSNIINYQM